MLSTDALQKQQFPTDRDLILAIFEAMGALALKLTGERLIVNVGDPAGSNYAQLYSSPSSTCWKKIHVLEGLSREEEKAGPCPVATSRCNEI
jgi:hypothetical protein